MKKYSKYLIGFAIFMGYYLVARNIENKFTAIKKLTNIGSGTAS